jgi:hypothetical protein
MNTNLPSLATRRRQLQHALMGNAGLHGQSAKVLVAGDHHPGFFSRNGENGFIAGILRPIHHGRHVMTGGFQPHHQLPAKGRHPRAVLRHGFRQHRLPNRQLREEELQTLALYG